MWFGIGLAAVAVPGEAWCSQSIGLLTKVPILLTEVSILVPQ